MSDLKKDLDELIVRVEASTKARSEWLSRMAEDAKVARRIYRENLQKLLLFCEYELALKPYEIHRALSDAAVLAHARDIAGVRENVAPS